jgi:hypothetical protein
VFPIFPVDYPYYRKGALFYHGRFEASNTKTIRLVTIKPEHVIAWLFDISSGAFSLFCSSNPRAANDKDHSVKCSLEVAVENVTQTIDSAIKLRESE